MNSRKLSQTPCADVCLLDEGAVKFGGMAAVNTTLQNAKRVIFLGCGTSWHAGLVGEYLFEELAGIPTEVEYASEFRYRSPIIEPGTIVFAISQSGETADTLAAIREAKRHGAPVFGICNVVGSSIARETDAGVYLHAGPEIGVASTKAFTSQITVLFMLALQMGRSRRVGAGRGRELGAGIEGHSAENLAFWLHENASKRLRITIATVRIFSTSGAD